MESLRKKLRILYPLHSVYVFNPQERYQRFQPKGAERNVEFVLTPQHRTSYDPEITTKEDFDYGRKITEERDSEVYRRMYAKPNEAEYQSNN